eukprot:TRINITY_DN1726_c0_g1_i2.p1 TRINITY_DN1726_c0_g1~~TRINITY_DN1726_c0_g1_i2.p1  ORF type:complete len:535 (-),score=110.00 TRINITY_DN1726_c0_g1_i2:242-1846(-)
MDLGTSCCVSGSALGAALLTLLYGKQQQQRQDLLRIIERLQEEQEQEQEQAVAAKAASRKLGAAQRGGGGSKARLNKNQGNPATQEESERFASERAGWEGFSMEDAAKVNAEGRAEAKKLSPAEVLSNLQRGNARFWTGCATRPEKSAFERRALIMKQFPNTAILACSDSRVPVEVIFDQGLGDMFVVRVAGNCLALTTTASLQYAVAHLGVKVLIVMGHEGCGAIKAAMGNPENINKEPESLAAGLNGLRAGLDLDRLSLVQDARAHDREAVITNVRRQVEGLCKDETIMGKVSKQELIVVGAFYEISSGIVDFFMEVTEAPGSGDDFPEAPRLLKRGVSAGVSSRLEVTSPVTRSRKLNGLPQMTERPEPTRTAAGQMDQGQMNMPGLTAAGQMDQGQMNMPGLTAAGQMDQGQMNMPGLQQQLGGSPIKLPTAAGQMDQGQMNMRGLQQQLGGSPIKLPQQQYGGTPIQTTPRTVLPDPLQLSYPRSEMSAGYTTHQAVPQIQNFHHQGFLSVGGGTPREAMRFANYQNMR